MSKQAEQDLENAIAQEQINNPDFFDECKMHNQVSDLVSTYLFEGRAPMQLTEAELKSFTTHVAGFMTRYYQSKNLK